MEGDHCQGVYHGTCGGGGSILVTSTAHDVFLLSTIVLYLLWLYRKRGIDRLWFIPLIH
jgi:hypothetical protein